MTGDGIPTVPEVPAHRLGDHRRSRLAGADRLARMDDGPATVFRWFQMHRLVESMANVFQDDRQLVLPPRRRHLHESLVGRVMGCTAAFRHIDARLEMRRLGHLGVVVDPETPYVLNAFAESHDPNRVETNPGLVRLTTSGFDVTESSFRPPDGSRCADLLRRCVGVAEASAAEAVVLAGWLVASFLAIHPFVDGNGRTARMLFQLVASSDDELRTDWGSLEQWSIRRRAYVDALKETQAPSMPDYDPRRVDPAPFVEFALRSATAGADLVLRRLEWFDRGWHASSEEAGRDAALVELAVVASASASMSELAQLVDEPMCTEVVSSLVALGRLRWDARGLLRPADANPLLRLPV